MVPRWHALNPSCVRWNLIIPIVFIIQNALAVHPLSKKFPAILFSIAFMLKERRCAKDGEKKMLSLSPYSPPGDMQPLKPTDFPSPIILLYTLLLYSTGLPAILLWFKMLSSSNWLLPDFQINIFQAWLWYCYSVVKIFQWLSFASSLKPKLAFWPQPTLSVFTPTLPKLIHLSSCNCVLDMLYPLWKIPSSSSYMWPFSTLKAITETT